MKLELSEATTMTKRKLSTYEREMKNPAFNKAFKESYKKLLFSELLIALMEDDEKSVRNLAQEAELSPTIIQGLRSGKQHDIKMSNFLKIVHAFGYKVFIQKDNDKISLEEKNKKSKKKGIIFVANEAA